MTREQAFGSVWAVIGSSVKSEQNTVVINMYQADDENYIKSWLQRAAIIHPVFLRINITVNVPIYYIFSLLQLIASTLLKPICYNSDFESSLTGAKDTFCTWERDEVRMSQLPCVSYPRFDDGGPGVQNTLHLSQGRDDKKITGDNSRHGIS